MIRITLVDGHTAIDIDSFEDLCERLRKEASPEAVPADPAPTSHRARQLGR